MHLENRVWLSESELQPFGSGGTPSFVTASCRALQRSCFGGRGEVVAAPAICPLTKPPTNPMSQEPGMGYPLRSQVVVDSFSSA